MTQGMFGLLGTLDNMIIYITSIAPAVSHPSPEAHGVRGRSRWKRVDNRIYGSISHGQSLYPQAELWEPLGLLGNHVSIARVLEALRAFPAKLIPGILPFMGLLPTLTPTLHSDPTLFPYSSVFLFQMELHDSEGSRSVPISPIFFLGPAGAETKSHLLPPWL